MVKSTSDSCAAASRCRMVLVEPPIAISKVIAFWKASNVAMPRGNALASSAPYQRWHNSTAITPARLNSASRSECVASTVPLPGNESPSASVRQFIEFAVNMPLQEPQVGQALRSTCLLYTSRCV